MAKKSRRSSRNFRAVRTKSTKSLGALATDTLIGETLLEAADVSYRFISADLIFSLEGMAAGEGPVTVGIANGDYTDAEIEAWVETTTGIDFSDKVAQEISKRQCRIIGTMIAGSVASQPQYIGDGTPVRVRLNTLVPVGTTMRFWAYNEDSGPLTTGAQLQVIGTCYLTLV